MPTEEQQAKQELSAAYEKAKKAGAIQGEECLDGLEFGRLCVKWHDWYQVKEHKKGDRIRFMWKALGIPHTAAYHWMGIARQKLGLNPPIIDYTKEELKHAEEKAANENRLCALFEGLMFPHDVKQNCARNEYHFNIIIGPLTETEVIEVASKLKELEGDVNAAAS